MVSAGIVELPTLFTPGFALDAPSIERNIGRLIGGGADRLCIMGPCGEYHALTLAAQAEYVSLCLRTVGDRARLLIGVLEAATDRVIERISAHQKLGDADYLVPIHYHFGVSHPSELLTHYRSVAESTGARVYALDMPVLTKRALTLSEMRDIAAIPGVRGVVRFDAGGAPPPNAASMLAENELNLYLSDGARLLCGWPRERLFSALSFLPEPFASGLTGALSLLNLSAHPAAALKRAAARLGLCASDALAPPYALSAREAALIDGHLDGLLWEVGS